MDQERPTQLTTSDLLQRVVEQNTDDKLLVRDLKNALHERGFGILLMIFALPNCIPVPMPPGYSSVFSIPLFIFSVQLMLGHDTPWLPSWIVNKRVKRTTVAKMVERASPILKRIENILRPRLSFASTNTGERIIGAFVFAFAVSIVVPLPLTNLIPAWGTLVMSLGLMRRDGLTIIIGMMIGTAGLILTGLIIHLGTAVVTKMLGI